MRQLLHEVCFEAVAKPGYESRGLIHPLPSSSFSLSFSLFFFFLFFTYDKKMLEGLKGGLMEFPTVGGLSPAGPTAGFVPIWRCGNEFSKSGS
jgi:hypothetical protein